MKMVFISAGSMNTKDDLKKRTMRKFPSYAYATWWTIAQQPRSNNTSFTTKIKRSCETTYIGKEMHSQTSGKMNESRNEKDTKKIKIKKFPKYAYATWWLVPRHTSLEEKARPNKIKRVPDEPIKNKDDNVISFVYSEQPYACKSRDCCPMRFSDKTMQQAHDVRCHGLKPSPPNIYRCRSCLKTNRTSMFSSKEAYRDHMMNPGLPQRSVTR